MKRRLRLALTAGAACIGLAASTLIAVQAAQAEPTNCTDWYTGSGPNGGAVICWYGTGSYRVSVQCDKPWWPDYTMWGEWKAVGSNAPSYTWCNGSDHSYGLVMYTIGPI